jgi:hypothetical protein
MRRLTVTVEDAVLASARKDVAAGRAASVSAWVSDAMRKKAHSFQELMTDIDALNRDSPPSDHAIDRVARSLGKTKRWVVQRLGLRRRRNG